MCGSCSSGVHRGCVVHIGCVIHRGCVVHRGVGYIMGV